MNAPARTALMDVVIEDVEYQRIGGEPLLARLYRPKDRVGGAGPFPAVVGVHGGAWTSGDRNNNQAIDQALAAVGVVVLALDFRLAPQASYPASVADVNYGVRWLKAHAAEFASRPDWVGAVAGSSGAHQMLLSALRPRDPRYAAATAPEVAGIDADISYMVACWPIADPLARYRMAVARGNERLVKAHHDYFGNEDAMQEGNPQLILERGENVEAAFIAAAAGDQGRQRHARHGREICGRLPRPRRPRPIGDVPGSTPHLRDARAELGRIAQGDRADPEFCLSVGEMNVYG